MATTYYSNKMTSPAEPARGCVGLQSISAFKALGADVVVNDVVQMFKLPKDAVILEMYLDSDELDSHGTPTIVLDVGVSGGDVDAFIDGSTIAQGGGIDNLDAARRGYKCADDIIVQVLVQAAPETTAAGDLALTCIYTNMPQDEITWS